MSVYERVNPLGIALLSPPKPVGAFVPFVRSGYLLFLSGHFAKRDGQPWKGQLGSDMTLAEGKAAARAAAIDVLGSLQSATGDLNEVIRIVKLLVLVNSSSTFTEHHLVANGASDLLVEVFGERGAHTRSAFAVAQIPFGSCVEVELVVEVASSVFRYRR